MAAIHTREPEPRTYASAELFDALTQLCPEVCGLLLLAAELPTTAGR